MEKKPSIIQTLLLLLVIMSLIITSMFVLKVEPHIPLFASLVIAVLFGLALKVKWADVEKAMIDGVKIGIKPIFILALVGMVIAVWMMSGTVPTLLFYGLSIISPEWFAVSTLFICMIVSSFTGSSFTTVGTIGVAMMGIGIALGVAPAIAAGAVVCGACFGDKMSPLSDTTNFAPGIVGVDLFEHIRHLLWTTIPSFVITVFLFLLIGRSQTAASSNDIAGMLTSINDHFSIGILTLLSPILVVFLAMRRYPTIPVLIIGIGSGLVTAAFMQGNVAIAEWFTVIQHGFVIDTGNEVIDGIVNRGGLQSMMWSISLVMIALILGGVIQRIGVIETLLQSLTRRLSSRGNVIAATAASSIGVNVVTGEQYLSILLPGKTFEAFYDKLNVAKKNLSRTLEDAGTLVNPLIPWGVSGAFFASTLGVDVIEYLPFAFFLLLSPIMTVLFGYLGIGVGEKTIQKENG
ncbi:Na+/H+ antiporter NhaC [Bacillus sp. FJAT-45037]|uniref:Na+/H+ antiporter NhaC n=1 Tax=Bacillus sp. FJAT-45037 TaxID=2011007 RepID=UPI000C2400B4|nr:Na+/H+ antiporter NhaC [Bacillus sp. FJAT-45037]